jgi:hypothetical protein
MHGGNAPWLGESSQLRDHVSVVDKKVRIAGVVAEVAFAAAVVVKAAERGRVDRQVNFLVRHRLHYLDAIPVVEGVFWRDVLVDYSHVMRVC